MNQPQILRSFILLVLLYSEGLAKPSLTFWVDRLKHDRILAALIGCSPDSLPPLGSCFDFMDRLWTAPETGLYARDKLLPASRNSRRPDKPKVKKQKSRETKPKIIEVIEKRIMAGKDISFNFEDRLQQLFYHAAILPSMACGIVPGERLTVSDDGTAVHTHACPRRHHRDDAPEDMRHFPDPSWGWDSAPDKYCFGYTLFRLSCHSDKLKADVPLLLRFTSARRHDSVSFLAAFHEPGKHMPNLPIENMCLDSAMDNYPTYRRLKVRGIHAFIDLNVKCGRQKTIPDTITIGKDGTPLCQEKLRMKPNGYDKSRGCLI